MTFRRQLGHIILMVVALVCLVGVGAGSASAEEEELVWKIAFHSYRDGGDTEIYVMDAEGTNQTRLTDNPGFDYEPAWSSDGSQIAFSSVRDGGNSEIYVMDADGTNQTNITPNSPGGDYAPSWSPVMLPVPEPSPHLAMATAVMSLCVLRRRRQSLPHRH